MSRFSSSPGAGAELLALGVRAHAWVVADPRVSVEIDLLYDLWVEAA